jgi:hypothetical protein
MPTPITIDRDNVAVGSSATKTILVQYGATVTQGQAIYKSSTDSKYYLADSNLIAGSASGIAITPGAADGFGLMAVPGAVPGQSLVNLGSTLVVGQIYCVGPTAGTIVPYADLVTGDYVTILGVAKTAALLDLMIIVSETVKPA